MWRQKKTATIRGQLIWTIKQAPDNIIKFYIIIINEIRATRVREGKNIIIIIAEPWTCAGEFIEAEKKSFFFFRQSHSHHTRWTSVNSIRVLQDKQTKLLISCTVQEMNQINFKAIVICHDSKNLWIEL